GSSSVVIGNGARWGCSTSIGCGSNVHTSAGAPVARACATAAPRMARWPRWTPSKTPSATALGRRSGGTDGRPRTIRMHHPHRPHAGAGGRHFTDPEQHTRGIVHAREFSWRDQPYDVGRQTVHD